MYTTQILFTFLFDLCFSQLIVVSTITGHPLRANNIGTLKLIMTNPLPYQSYNNLYLVVCAM